MSTIKPKIIDLFCGCGGFSLGAARAGFDVIAAIDNDQRILNAHSRNFPKSTHLREDISKISKKQLYRHLDSETENLIGVIGGPPCQGFSSMGSKNADDERNSLFLHFFRLVHELNPIFYICENVPGILRDRFENTRQKANKLVSDDYVQLPPLRLCASDYGAPTSRKRVFFIGYSKKYNLDLLSSDFQPLNTVQKITVKNALQGLPKKINPNWQTEEQGWRKVRNTFNGAYGKRTNNFIPPGIGDKEAISRLKKNREVSGCLGTIHADHVLKRYRALEQGDRDKTSKSYRLKQNGFCLTLRAGTGRDKGSHQAVRPIHPTQDRVITPREAARLQGFPDWFQFDNTKWHSFRQIGNSVSPILAEKILLVIKKALVK